LRLRYNTSREYENSINELRIERGLSIRELADHAGVCAGTMLNLAQGMISPFYQRGSINSLKPWVKEVAELLKVSVAELFPFEMCDINRKSQEFYRFQDPTFGEYIHYDIEREIDMKGCREALFRVIKTLTDKEQLRETAKAQEAKTDEKKAVIYGNCSTKNNI